MAMSSDGNTIPIALASMSKKADAKAKEVEGKLGHQMKGKAKQLQASAMNAGDKLRDGTQSVAKKVGDIADNIANDKS
jgi:hypothetical protein